MIDWFGQSAMSPKLVRILTASCAEVQGLQRLHAQAAQTAALAEKAIAKLAGHIEPSPPLFGAAPLEDVEMDRLQAWVSLAREACAGFWAARDGALEAAHDPRSLAWEQAVADLGEGIWLQQEGEALNGLAEEMRTRYAHLFRGEETDWRRIAQTLDWAQQFRALFPAANVPAAVARLVSAEGGDLAPLGAAIGPCRDAHSRVQRGIEYLTSLFTPMIFEPGGGMKSWALDTLCRWLEERVQCSADLELWIDFRRVQTECARVGLAPFFIAVMNRCPEEGTLHDLFYRRFYRLWLDRVYAQEPLLRQFRGHEHERLIRQFRALDSAQWKQYGPARVREAALARRQPVDLGAPIHPNSEPGILMGQLVKKRPKPLRWLFGNIPNLIQELKPCLLMSPITVSQLLDPSKFSFDLVIFDEASQICAEDAIGAIYRGKQVVVAGDRHQLPPTRFFAQGLVDGFDGDDGADGALDDDVYESVLDQCRTVLPTHPLRWHYRSRHESLIAFSNAYIYSHDPLESLKTFPSARACGPGLGVEFVHVPASVYDRGKSRCNPIEAAKVATLVIEHMRQSPGRSLGVVAFSEPQQMAILQEVERLRVRHT